ncbi:hypothetical protein B0H10DRAFT_1989359 [Mycena sp. CBHHK59/15]|nr:hypothetical protein B0H10DRAFT_1989359 [Mycena sp. CBHHK59/15]
MSEPISSSHHDPASKHKKKRRRDETLDIGDEVVYAVKENKKRRKHDKELTDASAVVEANLPEVQEVEVVVAEKKKEKKREKRKHDADGADAAASGAGRANVEDADGDMVRERKKKKKKRNHATLDADSDRRPRCSTADAPPAPELPAKKKRKKEQTIEGPSGMSAAPQTSSSLTASSSSTGHSATTALLSSIVAAATGTSSHPPPDGGSMFPLPNYMYFPGTQPNMSLFPTPTTLPLTFGSNDDVLKALQDLDLSKIAGVLKTLSDAADAANVPLNLNGISPSSTHLGQIPATPSITSEAIPNHPKHRRTLDMTLASSSRAEQQTGTDHARVLATKWLTPPKLAELVKTEGLVYKKGKFSAIELKQLNDAIETYRTTRGLSEEDMHKIIFPNDEKVKDAAFWTEITSAVPLRPIIAVYHHVRRSHHPLKQRGKWLPDEDARLIQAVASLGQHWEQVGHLVDRRAADCRDRYRNHIVNREIRVTGKDMDNEVFWGKVSSLMGGKRSRQQCRIKWTDSLSNKYKSGGQSVRWSQQDAFILIHKIDSLDVWDDSEIDWKVIPNPQWNVWSAHTLQRRWLSMKKSIKGFEDMTHAEIMDILRVKNAEMPHARIIKSAEYVEDSEDDEPQPGSSIGPGTLAGPDSG